MAMSDSKIFQQSKAIKFVKILFFNILFIKMPEIRSLLRKSILSMVQLS